MDLASVVAALASVGVRVSGSNPNNNIQGDSSRACPTGLAGPEPSGTHIDPGQHFHPDDKWVLVPLGHWNWKWNQAGGNYSTYEQELLAGMLVLSSQARLLGSNPVVWLCDQEPVRSFQKGPPPEKAKLRRWWTYLSQLRLTVHLSRE